MCMFIDTQQSRDLNKGGENGQNFVFEAFYVICFEHANDREV